MGLKHTLVGHVDQTLGHLGARRDQGPLNRRAK